MVMFVKYNVSVLSLIISSASDASSLQLYASMLLIYVSFCAYFSLFRVKFMSYYDLVAGQGTDDGSLIYNSTYCCRLVAPLCYNFLYMCHETSKHHIEKANLPAFSRVMGEMDTGSALTRINLNV